MRFGTDDKRTVIFDGAMGTMLQKRGLKSGGIPELLNLTDPELIRSIHEEYLDAGCDVVSANTFGANRFKAEKAGRPLEDIVSSGVMIAKSAASARRGKFTALDIGPCGRVLRPVGDLPFEEAVGVFAEIVRAGTAAGADLILLETFTDLYELKAAMIAAKENSDLPVLATMSFEENGTSFFGATVESMVMTLQSLGADALGVNCSLGPGQLVPIVERILRSSSIPVMVQPNAGLPVFSGGEAGYDVTDEEFADCIKGFVEKGVSIVGGCCGTDPGYIRLVKERLRDVVPSGIRPGLKTGICSASKTVFFGDDTVIIGERLNPTGKKALKAALRAKDMDYVLREAIRQQEQGAHILDVNMGLPDIDEPEMLERAVIEIQSVTSLPLQLDSSDPEALERAARVYNGKPLINSVNGKKDSLKKILPIARKYGTAVLGLTLDDDGIPSSAEGRLKIARTIVDEAQKIGIPREDVLIDCLVMTASAQQDQVRETLRAVRMVKEELGLNTVLGVSNVSFGLPARPVINRTMLAMALMQGLDAPIMDPGDEGMRDTVDAFSVLMGIDRQAERFIAGRSVQEEKKQESGSLTETDAQADLAQAIIKGLSGDAEKATEILLSRMKPMEIIEKEIVPSLDFVGKEYESCTIFLPQLIRSAEAAQSSFELIRRQLAKEGSEGSEGRGRVVIATVQGDIHDIGKNIVKVIMENYNYRMIDLGKDVPPEKIVEAVRENGADFVGLSALMTTSVSSMKATIAILREACPGVRVIVGGAVMTPSLAEYVGADHYAKDAMEAVRILGHR
ncbi:MAG TPA: homocysteine S-methyltransferase family protein [Synergistaceae bacterium]|jgi:5-methyltetrahydrofolate--homocysteine methyltransferase|nr:homocysteine S-methyltransferase family protein [Synergistaceae bacterium]NLL41464.1 dihydropteroate synthase [Synergistaceae bacterium]HPX03915.1 homocysteine S-methyltransferase family protein [Synergistaceae bacterium]HQA54895.1 homocysteine S-methyltransferase family protein [Synergistaceae bacterium]